jgi:hypothetical protein
VLAADILELPDDLEQINREYYMRGWTDGLPIFRLPKNACSDC